VVVEPDRGPAPSPGSARSSWPQAPAPGPLETAVGLVLAQAHPARPNVWAVLASHLLGVGGAPPLSVAEAAASVGRPAWWVRELLPRVRMVARHAGPPASLVAAVGVLEDGPVRTAAEASTALVAAGACTGPVHPDGVLRAAQVLGAACRVQLLAAEPGDRQGGDGCGPAGPIGPAGPAVQGRPAAVVVAPAGRAALVRAVMGAVVAAERRGDVVDLAAAAAAAGVPMAAAHVVIDRLEGWQTYDSGEGPYGPLGSGCGWWWAWRRPLVRKRGLVTSTAVRLLAARAYSRGELHAAVVDAVDRLPPTTRRDVAVPPAEVLAAWLTAQDLLEPAGDQADDGRAGGRLRCSPALALRSDAVLLEAVAAAGGTADTTQLAAGLRTAGYSASTSTQLARSSPVLVRVGWSRYAAR